VTINNNHGFSKGHNGFQIGPRMQELMVYAGQMDSYDNCNEIIQSFINVRVSAAQVYRLTDLYGARVGKQAPTRILEPVKQEEALYVQADGSMILTRENGWSEVKLGRIFKSTGFSIKTTSASEKLTGSICSVTSNTSVSSPSKVNVTDSVFSSI